MMHRTTNINSLHKFSFITLLLKNRRFFVWKRFGYWCASLSLCFVNYKHFTRLLVLTLFFHLHSCQHPFGATAEHRFRFLSCGTNSNTVDTVFCCHFVHISTLRCLCRRQDSLLQRKNPLVFSLNLLMNRLILNEKISVKRGDRGGTVVKVRCYKSEGRWFDPRWCQWNFLLT